MTKTIIHLLKFWALVFMLPAIARPACWLHWKMWALLAVWALIMWAHPAEEKHGTATDKTMRWISLSVWAATSVMVADWAYVRNTPGWTPLCWFGAGLLSAGLLLRLWAVRMLGPEFGSEVRLLPGHRLVMNGPYRIIRHPAYLGSWLFFVGQAAFLDSWLGMAVSVLLLSVAYSRRIAWEEQVLAGRFREVYAAYCTQTWRLLPFIY